MRALPVLATIFIVIDLVGAAVLFFSRDVGDAVTRGLGQGLAVALAMLGVVAALLLGAGRATDRSLLVLLACVISAVPAVSAVALTMSRQRVLGMIFPSMRDHTPREASPKYAFPDSAGREAALAIIYGDFAKLDTLLHATPRPDLTARDELGNSLLGLATSMAIADGGSMRDIESLRLLLAAGARPMPEPAGSREALIEMVAQLNDDRRRKVLEGGMPRDRVDRGDFPMQMAKQWIGVQRGSPCRLSSSRDGTLDAFATVRHRRRRYRLRTMFR